MPKSEDIVDEVAKHIFADNFWWNAEIMAKGLRSLDGDRALALASWLVRKHGDLGLPVEPPPPDEEVFA